MEFKVKLNKSELIILIDKLQEEADYLYAHNLQPLKMRRLYSRALALKEELSKKCCKKQLSTVSGKE